MKRDLVYDFPTRVFHWLFSILFVIAILIAKTFDDDSWVFNIHSIIGLTLAFIVSLRIVWGFIGTQHARFSGFALKPKDLLNYFLDILSGNRKTWSGHNPASSWIAIVMMTLAIGLASTGYLMTSGPNGDFYEDVHEILANAFILAALLHIAGIAFHTFRHRDMIGLSMIDGKKEDIPTEDIVGGSKPFVGVVFLVLVLAFSLYLVDGYDRTSGTLTFFGTTLQLKEK